MIDESQLLLAAQAVIAWADRTSSVMDDEGRGTISALRQAVQDVIAQPECCCDGGEQGEGLVSIPHEPHCPLWVAS